MPDKWMSEPSEFGGVPGEVQPPPHELESSEQAKLERRVNPGSVNDSVEAQRLKAQGGQKGGG